MPANATQETLKFSIDVSKFVDNLGEKHAISLVAEGPDSLSLFNLIGLGFSSVKKKIVRPVAPTVSIKVNGEEIELPATPVRSTNANGITGLDLYEATCKLSSNNSGIPTVSASVSSQDVKVEVTQAESTSGTAVVKFDYKGIVKTYNVVFAEE